MEDYNISKMKNIIMDELDRLTKNNIDMLEVSRSNAISSSILTYIKAENLIIRRNELLYKEQNMMNKKLDN